MKLNSLIGKCCVFNMKWFFDYGLKFSAPVGVLGAVGIALGINFRKHLGFSAPDYALDYPRPWVVPGLENFGNNCFLNVVLQALASCSSFRNHLREMMEEYGENEDMPLINSLNSLVEELCTVHHEARVISPKKLMLAIDHYIPSFNLARQQDAEEAFSRLLSLLREEISDNFSPKSCLAYFSMLDNGRILVNGEEESQWQRWRRFFLKPFDGILRSILVCHSCSLQIYQDFELFTSLHLSPPLSSYGRIVSSCTLEMCLKRFFAADHIENYTCTQCWHDAAIDYLSMFSDDETNILKVQRCSMNESCECKTLPSLEGLPWANSFSHVCKQPTISRCPEILCIHLQRASYDMYGEPVKLLGHIAFPVTLDLSSFMSTLVGSERKKPNVSPPSQKSNWEIPVPFSKQLDSRKVNGETRMAKRSYSETANGSTSTVDDGFYLSVPVKRRQMHKLVSVVEHFGTGQNGHYTIYRKAITKIGDEEDTVGLLGSSSEQWFCISDTEVVCVPEKDVLEANASMLFYEKID